MPSKARADTSSVFGAIDHVVLVRLLGTPKDRTEHPVEHGKRGVDESGLHLARQHHKGRETARRIETRKVLCAYNRAFAGDCRVAGAMNARFAIGSHAELARGFKPFDDLDEVPLSWRFRPFAQPSKRRALFVFGDDEQGFQSRDCLRRQAFDKTLVGALASKGARRQGDLFQGDGGGKQYAPFAQIFDHRRHDDIATVRTVRQFDRDMSDGALIVATKGANVEVGLKIAEMFPTRFTTLGVNAKVRRLTCNLLGDESEHVSGRRLFDAEHPTGKSEIGEVHGKPEPVGRASALPDQRHVLGRESVVTHDRRRVGRRVE